MAGENTPALGTVLSASTVAVDPAGNIYVWENLNSRIRKINTAGIVSTVASTSGQFKIPVPRGGLATDSAGNLYIGDTSDYVVRKVDASGVMTTIAGMLGTIGIGATGNGQPATSAAICSPSTVAADHAGNVYFGSSICGTIRKIDPSGTLSTFWGGSGTLGVPVTMAMDSGGTFYIANLAGNRIFKLTSDGTITPYAGTGTAGNTGDGGAATSAQLQGASGLAVDGTGNLYIACGTSVRRVDASGVISTVAGGGKVLLDTNGVSVVATSAAIGATGVAVDTAGNLYIANNWVYKVTGLPSGPSTGGGGSPAPVISAVENGASFQSGVVANSWVAITGANLAPKTDDWSNSIVAGALPQSVDNVSVSIGGKPAYVYYISPNQLNVLAPDVPAGPVTVTVTSAGTTSASFTSTATTYSPAMFLWPGNQAVATRTDYSYAVKPGTFTGVTTVAAKPGDVVILWATGFGPTNPAAPPGVVVSGSQAYATTAMPTVTINGVSATVYGAALSPGSAGLYQIAIQVPASLADGDWPIQASIGGVQSPAGAILSVHQ